MFSQRVVNLFVPRIHKEIVDILALQEGHFPFGVILSYTGLKLLQGGTGACRLGNFVDCSNEKVLLI